MKVIFYFFCLLSMLAVECKTYTVPEPKKNDVSKVESSELVLSANEVFFSPTGTLRAAEDKSKAGKDFNKGRFFTHIESWENEADTLIWGVQLLNIGKIKITPVMGVTDIQSKSKVNIAFGDDVRTFTVNSTTKGEAFLTQESVEFKIEKPGSYTIKLWIKTKNDIGEIGSLKECKLEGTAIIDAVVWQRRWRPLAVHCQWRNSSEPDNISLAVHENTIVTTDISCYQPITTPFGYYGSSWNPELGSFGGLNFSLWSFKKGDAAPPIVELSHLVAVGKGLIFGGYSHEGTGVKPRGKNPFDGKKRNKQLLAVRKVPGEKYDTYYSHYFDCDISKWVLFACGKKYNKSGDVKYLRTGAFVEQPGAPDKERSGHITREVNYRGWLMDENGKWFSIDKMVHNGNDSKLSFKEWGVNKNHFYMKMGGLLTQEVEPGSILLPNPPSPEQRPGFLKGENLKDLLGLPSEIQEMPPSVIKPTSVEIQFEINKLGTNSVATLYWGTKDMLTFDVEEDWTDHAMWEQSNSISVSLGVNKAWIDNLLPGTKYYYRVKIINDEGITWMMDTQSFETIR